MEQILPEQQHGLPYNSHSMNLGKDDIKVHERFSKVIQSAVVTFCKIAALPMHCTVCTVFARPAIGVAVPKGYHRHVAKYLYPAVNFLFDRNSSQFVIVFFPLGLILNILCRLYLCFILLSIPNNYFK